MSVVISLNEAMSTIHYVSSLLILVYSQAGAAFLNNQIIFNIFSRQDIKINKETNIVCRIALFPLTQCVCARFIHGMRSVSDDSNCVFQHRRLR
jgi:hypothetical protein